jgi:cytochrome c553
LPGADQPARRGRFRRRGPPRRTTRLARGALLAALLCLASAHPLPAQSLAERLAPCLACHGENGRSDLPLVPSLGGQPVTYLLIQLVMFRERLRPIEPMSEMTKGVSDDDLRAMADLLARQPPPAPAPAGDPARMARARALVAEHRCNFCHGADFSGEAGAARLAGQREDYLLGALRGYRDQSRRAYEPQMADAVYPLHDADLADLAYLLARLP